MLTVHSHGVHSTGYWMSQTLKSSASAVRALGPSTERHSSRVLLRAAGPGPSTRLAALWRQLALVGIPFTMLLLPLRKPSFGMWDDGIPLVSPYAVNPLGMAPLRMVLGSLINESALENPAAPTLFVNAVSAQTGLNRVFKPGEVTIDALLASACAPLVFQAIPIDGESYWDGSYGANPALWPLFHEQHDVDIFLVELTPLLRRETPMSAKNILNRIKRSHRSMRSRENYLMCRHQRSGRACADARLELAK